jgi:hypothetical protein
MRCDKVCQRWWWEDKGLVLWLAAVRYSGRGRVLGLALDGACAVVVLMFVSWGLTFDRGLLFGTFGLYRTFLR